MTNACSFVKTAYRPSLPHKPLAKLCAEAGVTRLNVHGLRHVAAALGYHATGDALAVQRRLGHSSVSTTMRIYAYLLRDDMTVADAMDSLLARPMAIPAETEIVTQQGERRQG